MSEIVDRVRDFVRDQVLPLDDAHDGDIASAGGDNARRSLQAAARTAGLLSPHAPRDLGGLGLGMVGRAALFEEAGYSLFGPISLNVQAPDEGNMHLLDAVGSSEQRAQYLAPLVAGECRSAFAMTEPSPGAGSDPTRLTTRAALVDKTWRIDGHKHFITGADGAGFLIVMARTSGVPGDNRGATMFLIPADARGIEVRRHIRTQDRSMVGGHCEVVLDGVSVTEEAVLGEVDRGFQHAQLRLGPARMTHVMRWTGAARRAHETAVRYATERTMFGSRQSSLGMTQQMIADNEIDLAATRALMLEACRQLDDGDQARVATSIAKTFAAEALNRVVDRAAQICGGAGVAYDLPIAKIAREIRPFRIYDGPSEVHRMSISKYAVRRLVHD